jgi:type VI secretion system secreted protein VgrG
MAPGTRTRLALSIGPVAAGDLLVRRVAGREALSAPFRFEVAFEPRSGEPLELRDLVGKAALLRLERPDGTARLVHGMAAAVELAGWDRDRPRYRAVLLPRLGLLRQTLQSRVFQDRSAVEAVQAVLGEGQVGVRLALRADPPKRGFFVQYRETDADLVARLLEEEGIFTWYEHGEEDHVLVLGDDVSACPAVPGSASLPHRAGETFGEGEGDEHVAEVSLAGAVRPDRAALRDFDFEKPALDLTASQALGRSGIERYEYPAGYTDPAEGKRRARLRIEELRGGEEGLEGRSNCLRLAPGLRFEIEGHPDPAMSGDLVVAELVHGAVQTEAAGEVAAVEHHYRNWFRALPTRLPHRPPRRARRPALPGVQTATVAGPPGEEIHPDAHGRIKVKLRWDREGPDDDRASCWIRVAQAWAGPGFGASFVPRAGQEVVVSFLEGDPDRPLVVGSVYHGANAPPLDLPGSRSQSTVRSDSSPGGGGGNELRLEDAAEGEEVYLHARRDERVVVENDKAQEVRRSERLVVGKDRAQEVLGFQRLEVAGLDATEVGGNRSLTVGGDRAAAVVQSHREEVTGGDGVQVGGNQAVVVAAASAESVGLAAALTVGGAYAVSVAGALNEAVGAAKGVEVAGAHEIWVGATRSEQVEKDASYKAGGDVELDVSGALTLSTGADQGEQVDGASSTEVKEPVAWSAKSIVLQADELTILVGGKKLLSIAKSGSIEVAASSFAVDGSDIVLKGSKLQKDAAGSVGSGSASVAALADLTDPRAMAEFALADPQGRPVANQAFRVEFADGTVKKGKTDGSGKGKVSAPKAGSYKLFLVGVDPKDAKKA